MMPRPRRKKGRLNSYRNRRWKQQGQGAYRGKVERQCGKRPHRTWSRYTWREAVTAVKTLESLYSSREFDTRTESKTKFLKSCK